ncbi:glycosyltransferase [Vulgatibacter incomptus]|uniref:Trehalose synthase n=1 Tax=Vulgatibacter incomptus TaxID=1391653 RepID=A0A0K1P8R0_9BACT|nr:glycosyltransferase [Vulgatibacter incomptus]AKU89796.1 Trehalose synthase [Vulgatibacter incomptus]
MATTVQDVPIHRTTDLELYRELDEFGPAIEELRRLAAEVAAKLGRGRVWMLSSTESGGGVAEMMPRLCSFLADLGIDTRWLVLKPDDPDFFRVTKALHNMIHGEPGLVEMEAAHRIYDRVSREAAHELRQVQRRDLLVVHDPQPAGVAVHLQEAFRPTLVWRCHVGTAKRNACTDEAWSFLRRYLDSYERLIFSLLSYAPQECLERCSEVVPGIDPLSHKNRALRPYKLVGVLRAAGLIDGPSVPDWASFEAPVHRFREGAWTTEPIANLLHVPTIVQISRFDRLKGFAPLLPAFEHLLSRGPSEAKKRRVSSERTESEISRAHLLLAGPDPKGVADDPEAGEVLEELCALQAALPRELRERVHLLRLPMADVKQNALIVNALQRMALVVVQNSKQEGFGLTVAEALWKGTPVAGADVSGIAAQIRDGTDGILIADPTSPESIAEALLRMLSSPLEAETMARTGRARVRDHFTILAQIRGFLRAFDRALEGRGPGA